jgi:hypothetical protein
MWILLPIAGLVVAGIAALVSGEETQARSNWESKHRQVGDELRHHRQNIEGHLSQSRQVYDFYVLNEAYYASFKAADIAYALLRDCKTSLGALKKMLVATDQKRHQLKAELQQKWPAVTKAEKIAELRNLTQFKMAVIKDFDELLAQKQGLYKEVCRLNQQTQQLKRTIAEQCGSKGKQWHSNLQQRVAERRSHTPSA